ncbi:MAG: Asp-tRNA(Asn)/Glu-tRNA(Gln) amidotransferase subunit GatA [Gammaproteobacteria bacterium]
MQHKTVSELHDLLVSKTITPTELVNESLKLAKKYSSLNCFNFIDEERALTKAKTSLFDPSNPLSCIPVAHKDLFCIKGMQTTCSSKILDGYLPPFTATVVQNLDKVGCITIAKTNMDEFAMGSSNETSYFGNVHNPWLKNHVPGGSSGGAAASVSSGIVPLATGTDTGGSIRQPAALCNLTGLKPTYGRISRWGMIAFASSLDQAGPIAHTAKDCAIALDAMTGHDCKDTTSLAMGPTKAFNSIEVFSKDKTLGIVKEFSDQLSHDMEKAFQESINTYKQLGYKIKEISLPNIKYSVPTYYVIAPAECSSNLSRFDGVRFGLRSKDVKNLEELYINSRSEGFGNEVKRRILIGTYVLSAGYYDAYYKKAQQVRRLITSEFKNAFEQCDLILTPTSPGTAFAFDSKGSKDPTELYLEDLFTIAANLAGIPAISVPQKFVNGLPSGHQLIAPHLHEESILQTAHHFQLNTDWHLRTPQMEEFA